MLNDAISDIQITHIAAYVNPENRKKIVAKYVCVTIKLARSTVFINTDRFRHYSGCLRRTGVFPLLNPVRMYHFYYLSLGNNKAKNILSKQDFQPFSPTYNWQKTKLHVKVFYEEMYCFLHTGSIALDTKIWIAGAESGIWFMERQGLFVCRILTMAY